MQELHVVGFGVEAHDALYAGTVVPTSIEQNQFSGCGQVRDVALDIPLCFLALGRCAQGDDAANARIEALGDRLDCYALAGGGAPLKTARRPSGRAVGSTPATLRARSGDIATSGRSRSLGLIYAFSRAYHWPRFRLNPGFWRLHWRCLQIGRHGAEPPSSSYFGSPRKISRSLRRPYPF